MRSRPCRRRWRRIRCASRASKRCSIAVRLEEERQAQHVARRLGDEHGRRLALAAVRFQGPAKAGDVALQGAERRARRLVAPQPVDEPLDGHDPARFEREVGEYGTLLRTAQLDGLSLTACFDRAQDVHRQHDGVV